MRGVVLATILAVSAFAASAESPTAETVTFGNRVLSVGDPVGRVMEIAGKPDRNVELQNGKGAAIGERFEYFRDGKTILVTIADGRVSKLEEVR